MSNPGNYSLRSHQPDAIIEQPQYPARRPDPSHLDTEDQSPVHQPKIDDSEEQEIGIINSHLTLD